MSKNNIETDVRIALDNASLENISEIMEDIDPAEFKLPQEVSLGRIKKSAMRKIEKKRYKKFNVFKVASGIVAAAAVAFALVLTFSTQVRAAVFGMFTFVPGVGMVETDSSPDEFVDSSEAQDDQKIVEEVSKAFDTNIYMLGNPYEQSGNNDLDLELISMIVKDGMMKIEYHADLKKVSLEMLDNIYTDEASDIEETDSESDWYIDEMYLQRFVDMYDSLGYDKYFEINSIVDDTYQAVKYPKSKLSVDGKEILPFKSAVYFSEASSARYVDIVETYDISYVDIDAINSCGLFVGDLEIPVGFENAKAYAAREEAAGERVIVSTDEGIELMYDASFKDGLLNVDVYPLSLGIYDEISYLDVLAWADGEELDLCPPSDYTDNRSLYHFEFGRYEGELTKDMKYTFSVNGISVIGSSDEEIVLEMDDSAYGVHDVNKEYSINGCQVVVDRYKIFSMNDAFAAWNISIDEYVSQFVGDCIEVKINDLGIESRSKMCSNDGAEKVIEAFRKITINGTDEEIAEFWMDGSNTLELFTGKENGEVNSIHFSEPYYYIATDLESDLAVK